MINNMEELLELVALYHTWISRTLKVLLAVALVYGGYKYGYSHGINRAFEYVKDHAADICGQDKAESSYQAPNLHENQPGKMWSPEA